jgi:hypothetical protein
LESNELDLILISMDIRLVLQGGTSVDHLTRIVQVELSDGSEISVEATLIGEQQVALRLIPFEQIGKAIEGISKELVDIIKKVSPDKATVKLGLDIGLETNGLTVLLAKGSGKANLEVTFEWAQDAWKEGDDPRSNLKIT